MNSSANSVSGLPPGTIVGRYRTVERTGAGGMGTVYRAHDPMLERDIALKLLPPHLTADPEARAAAAPDHPNICTAHKVGESHVPHISRAISW